MQAVRLPGSGWPDLQFHPNPNAHARKAVFFGNNLRRSLVIHLIMLPFQKAVVAEPRA